MSSNLVGGGLAAIAQGVRRFEGAEVTPQGVAFAVGLNGKGKIDEWDDFLSSFPDLCFDRFTDMGVARNQRKLLLAWLTVEGSPAELRFVQAGSIVNPIVEAYEVFKGQNDSNLATWKQRVIECMQKKSVPQASPASRMPTQGGTGSEGRGQPRRKTGRENYLPRKLAARMK